MNTKTNFFAWLGEMLKIFLTETATKPQYQIVDIFECKSTGLIKVVIKLSSSHIITKPLEEIIIDNNFIENFDKKTIRTLSYLATIEKLKPDYSVELQKPTDLTDEYILEIKSKRTGQTFIISPTTLSKDKKLLSKFDVHDANRIGYLAGVRETVKEYEMK